MRSHDDHGIEGHPVVTAHAIERVGIRPGQGREAPRHTGARSRPACVAGGGS